MDKIRAAICSKLGLRRFAFLESFCVSYALLFLYMTIKVNNEILSDTTLLYCYYCAFVMLIVMLTVNGYFRK